MGILTGCFTSPKGCDNMYIKRHCIVVLVIENSYKLRKKQPPEVILDNITDHNRYTKMGIKHDQIRSSSIQSQ